MVVDNYLLDRLGRHVKHEGLLLLLPPHVLVESPLHLLGVQPLKAPNQEACVFIRFMT